MASDLVANVMAAADPTRIALAQQRLERGQAAAAKTNPEAQLFQHRLFGRSDLVAGVLASASSEQSVLAKSKLASLQPPADPNAGEARKAKAMQQLEGTLIANALESMIPEPTGSLFGDATAGQFWRGEQIRLMADAVSSRSMLNLASDPSGAGGQPIKAFAFGISDDKS